MKTRITNMLAALMIVGFSFYLSGCATTVKVDSTRDISYENNLSRIFILVAMFQYNEKLSAALSQSIKSAFLSNGIAAEVINLSSLTLELDTSVYDDQIKNFSPDAIMKIFETNSLVTMNMEVLRIIFDASLYESDSNKRFWRANITVKEEGNYITYKDADLIADTIITKLKEDGLIKDSRNNYLINDTLAENPS